MDEEDIEYFHEDIKKVDKIIKCKSLKLILLVIMEINGTLIHVYKGQISAVLKETLVPLFAQTLFNLKEAQDYEALNAVCFLADILEHGGDDIFNEFGARAVEKFIESIELFSLDRGILQSAGYGLGVVAQRTPKGAFPQLEKVAKILHAIISEEDARTDEDKAESTDNVISAFGKLVIF